MADYSRFLIKDYKHWAIYIFENQGYLGRCIVWCKRENALDLTEATADEQQELFIVLNQLKNAIQEVFQADWYNYAFLGNETRHLHGHFIPRYSAPKDFMGIKFEDVRWGHNYKTDPDFKIPEDVLKEIQRKIKVSLG